MAAQDTSVGEAAESTRDAPVFVPPADIIEDQSSLLMVLDLPGADPERGNCPRVQTGPRRCLTPEVPGPAPIVASPALAADKIAPRGIP